MRHFIVIIIVIALGLIAIPQATNAPTEIKIYTKAMCSYCVKAKDLLHKLRLPFEEIDVGENPDKWEELINTTNVKTVPYIYIGDKYIGGYDDLNKLYLDNKLVELMVKN